MSRIVASTSTIVMQRTMQPSRNFCRAINAGYFGDEDAGTDQAVEEPRAREG